MEDLITIKEAADVWGCTPPNIYQKIKAGLLPSHKDGRKRLVSRSALIALRDKKSAKKRGATSTASLEAVEDEVAPASPPIGAGDKLLIHGEVWQQDFAPPYEWSFVTARDVVVQVLGLQANQEGTLFAYAKAPGSGSLWAVRISDFSAYTLVTEDTNLPTEHAKAIDRVEFVPSLLDYVEARDAKLRAEAALKKAQKEHRDTIEGFIYKYGEESSEGKGDFVVREAGYKAMLARTPGKEIVSYDDEARLRWIMADFESRKHLVKTVVDEGQWNLEEEEGRIPAGILQEVKDIKETEDKFRLRIDLDKTEE